jgi:hypothetical protein
MKFLRFLRIAIEAYWTAGECGVCYKGLTANGVPLLVCFVATGREAWRVTDIALTVKGMEIKSAS